VNNANAVMHCPGIKGAYLQRYISALKKIRIQMSVKRKAPTATNWIAPMQRAVLSMLHRGQGPSEMSRHTANQMVWWCPTLSCYVIRATCNHHISMGEVYIASQL
jgi:hypothetical protein